MAWWNPRQASPEAQAWLNNEAPGRTQTQTSPLWRRLLIGEQRALTSWDVFGEQYIPGTMTSSGTPVSEVTAFKFNIVYAAITLIADGVSSLTPQAYVEQEDGTLGPGVLPLWIRAPHPEIRRFDVFNQLMVSVLAWGDGFALFMRRPSDGVIVGLQVLDPATVQVEWDKERPGFRRYKVNNGPWLTANEILHIQGPSLPGRPHGMSVVSQAREAIGLGMTLEEFGSRYFSQGSQAKVVLTVPNRQVGDEEAKAIIRTFERWHRGKGNWFRPAIASGGATVQNISIPPDDAQFLQSREFQATTIASWFRVPPHRVGIVGKSTSWGSGLAEENMAMLQHTFRPWILRLEGALTAYSPGREDRGTVIKLDDSILQRGTFKEAAETWTSLVEKGVATPDEARRKLGLKPLGGDADKLRDPMAQPQMGDGGDPRTKEQDRKRKQDEAAGRAVRFNPNHDSSGKFSSGPGGRLSTTTLGPLSAAGEKGMQKLYAEVGTSPEKLDTEIESKLTPEYIAQGKQWYPHANEVGARIAAENDISHDQAMAVLAAVSPQKNWDTGKGNNVEVAEYLAKNYRQWDGVPAERVGSELVVGRDGKSMVALHTRMIAGDRDIGIAMQILRANPDDPAEVHRTIDQFLTGLKRRSFYNNMSEPAKTQDVTIDAWMTRALVNTSSKGISLEKAKGKLYASDVSTVGGSGYRAVSESTRRVGKKLGLAPDQVQAAYWSAVRDQFENDRAAKRAAKAAGKAAASKKKRRLSTGEGS